jgi:hypothetical protein
VVDAEIRVTAKHLAWSVTFDGVCYGAPAVGTDVASCSARVIVDVDAVTGKELGLSV